MRLGAVLDEFGGSNLRRRIFDRRGGRLEVAVFDSCQAGRDADRGGVGVDVARHRNGEVAATDQPRVMTAQPLGVEIADGFAETQQRLAVRMGAVVGAGKLQEPAGSAVNCYCTTPT